MNLPNAKQIAFGLTVVTLGWYLISGIRIITPQELGVSVVFGKAGKKIMAPGIHYLPPRPWGTVLRVKVNEHKRVYIGKIGEWTGDTIRTQHPDEMEYLTGDANILHIKTLVQYQVADPLRYLFCTRYIDHHIEFLTETELWALVGRMTVDDVLTTGKAVLQVQLRNRLQVHLDALESGVKVVSVQFRDVAPPYEVVESFNQVWASKQEKEQRIYQARGYAGELEHQARGESVQTINRAEASSAESQHRTAGRAEKFLELEREYRQAPALTRKRIYLEKMEKILSRVSKVISG